MCQICAQTPLSLAYPASGLVTPSGYFASRISFDSVGGSDQTGGYNPGLASETGGFNPGISGETGGFNPGLAADNSETPVYGGGGPNFWASQSATSDTNTNGVLSGSRWGGATLSYSFPTSTSHYESGYSETSSSFSAATAALQTATRYAMGLVSQYTNLATTEVGASSAADVRTAFSTAANPTAYAYYPSNSTKGGDIWYGTNYTVYQNPVKGQYAWATVMHELGHALGLKHGHETGGPGSTAMNTAQDQMSYSIMTYRSYVNAPLSGYTNETNGYAQTFMMYDIAALQQMYGANFNTNAGDTTYTWNASTGEMSINGVGQGAPGGNRIFMTLWDGNGTDTYDFSNYTTNLNINLTPGSHSSVSSTQTAYLGGGYSAAGNIFNALQFGSDTRSLIEIANGGSGNDTIIGNAANNILRGNAGNDTLTGGAGNDTIDGGTGTDIATFSGAYASYALYSYNGSVLAIGEGTDSITNVETFQFSDRSVALASIPVFRAYDYLASYADLRSAFGSNTDQASAHFFNSGINEGRSHDLFGNFQYIGSYDDLIGAYGTNQDGAAEHYVRWGAAEGRSPTAHNFMEYGASYADLMAAFGTNLESLARHYIESGRNEGRSRDAFNNLNYIASYNDLMSAFGTNQDAAVRHYFYSGYSEGRNANGFDPLQYIASYGDLIRAFGTNTDAAATHFINFGSGEGRSRDSFNATQYLAKYADLRAAFGTNENAATRHYIEFGFNEGRTDTII